MLKEPQGNRKKHSTKSNASQEVKTASFIIALGDGWGGINKNSHIFSVEYIYILGYHLTNDPHILSFHEASRAECRFSAPTHKFYTDFYQHRGILMSIHLIIIAE